MAERCMPQKRRMFIQMSGPPGSGKSTMAYLLARATGAVCLNHDITRSTVSRYVRDFGTAAKLAYDLGWASAEELLKQEQSVIIDSPCYYEQILEKGEALAKEYGFEYWYVECQVGDIKILDERLRKRTSLSSQRTRVDRFPADAGANHHGEDPGALFKRDSCRPDCNAIVLDTTRSLEECRVTLFEQMWLLK